MTHFARLLVIGSLALVASTALGQAAVAVDGPRKCSCSCLPNNPPVIPAGDDGGEDNGNGPTQCWQKTGNGGGWIQAGSCNIEVEADNCKDAENTVGVTRDGNGNITGDGNSCTVTSGPNPPAPGDIGNGHVKCKDITDPPPPAPVLVPEPVATLPVVAD